MTASVRFNGSISAYANSTPVSGVPVTLMAWVWMQAFGSSHVAGLYNSAAEENIVLSIGRSGNNRMARTTCGNSGYVLEYDPGSTTYWSGRWRHFAATISESAGTVTGHIYLDGEQVATSSAGGTPVTASCIGIGSRTNGTSYWDLYANAYVADVRAFDRVLTGDEVRDIYIAGEDHQADMTGLWRLQSNYADSVGAITLSTNGSPTFSAEEPPIFYPSPIVIAGAGASPPAGGGGYLNRNRMLLGVG